MPAPSTSDPLSPSESHRNATSTTVEHEHEHALEQGRDNLRALFDHFDENKDGNISREELRSSLERLGMAVPSAELADMIDSVDANKDGFVNYEEFVDLYESLQAKEGAAEDDVELRRAFEVFDQNGDGLITAQELHGVLQSMGVLQGRSLADCIAMIRRVDSDANGQVDFQEFKHMMSG